MAGLPKYDPKSIEPAMQQQWHENSPYRWDATIARDDSYVIDTPPPTVSGILHMGHIFSYTQADFVARYQRMKGKNVFYPMGFDDNGLPTERLVEKQKNIRAANLPREDFIAICREVVESSEADFRSLFHAIGLSVDWEQEYQTISDASRSISQLSFLHLYEKGEIYRKMQPTLWDAADRTALAQADIEEKEMPGAMHQVHFGIEDSDAKATIATTRPELLPACVAVLFHPDDERYQHLVGKHAITPIFGIKVPFIADDTVLMEKGTGLVMCCTFGDQTDVEWWKKHDLPLRVIVQKDGTLGNLEPIYNGQYPSVACDMPMVQSLCEALTGMKIKAAREAIVQYLADYRLLGEVTPITHAVKCAERSGAPLEILVTPQWFIRITDKKQALHQKADALNWHPAHMKIRLKQWIDGLGWDWCISRQRYFGVPFPVWYIKPEASDEQPITHCASKDELPANPLKAPPKGYDIVATVNHPETGQFSHWIAEKHGNRYEITPDFDVMDTWATSSVSPQLSSHGIAEGYMLDEARHKALFPADLRPQAHEIIRTWMFYTIAKGLMHEDALPWQHVMISGWCLASDKSKMSKSKGNVIDPRKLLEQHGADAVRYWASTSRLGADTAFNEETVKIGRRLVMKLWNASQFAAMHFGKWQSTPTSLAQDMANGRIHHPTDCWMAHKLMQIVNISTKEFEKYEYADARQAAEDSFWKDWCDNYLELCKSRTYQESHSADRESAALMLYHGLDIYLRLFAPFIPFATDALHQHLFNAKQSIHSRGTWPKADFAPNLSMIQMGEDAIAALALVRKLKAEANLSVKYPIAMLHIEASGLSGEDASGLLEDVKQAANAANIAIKTPEHSDGWRMAKDDARNITIALQFADSAEAA